MPRAAILNDYQGVALTMADWSALDGRVELDVFREHIPQQDALIAALQPYEIVVAMRERTAFPEAVISALPNLRLLVTTGPRNAAIDVAACEKHGVVVSGTGGEVRSTAELTWALILAAARHVPTEIGNVRSGGWMTTVGTNLAGATLGLCGLGNIGGLVARVGAAFGMNLVAWSQNLTAARCAEFGAQLVSKEELFAQSDFLTIHLVLSERTRGLVGAGELALMKPTAWVINTSRGPITDEAALAEACAQRRIAGAGIDAFEVEPLPADHPFRTLGNVLATPHIGYVSEACYRIFYRDIVEDIAAYLAGAPVRVVAAG
ncbi:MAG: D-2-hydroxyacid dehydrogenase family protein [Acidimicrobiales bacterium]